MNIFFDFNFMCKYNLFHNLKILPIRCMRGKLTGKKTTNHPMCISGPLVRVHSWRKHLPISALFHRNLCFIHKCSVRFYGGLYHPQVFQFSFTEGYITHKCSVLFYGGLHHPSVQLSITEGLLFTNKCSVLFYRGLHHPEVFSPLLLDGLFVTGPSSSSESALV
jgi:hypothetical protein